MKGYKGFNSKFQAVSNGLTVFQYEVGKTYTHEGELKLYYSGFHFCTDPLDVLRFYAPSTSRYAIVEAENVSEERGTSSKRVCGKITIVREISAVELAQEGNRIGKVTSQRDFDCAIISRGASSIAFAAKAPVALATGRSSYAFAGGGSSMAITCDRGSSADARGQHSIAAALGPYSKAKASIGNRLVLAEYNADYILKDVQAFYVDGESVKADTYYRLSGGKLVECE